MNKQWSGSSMTRSLALFASTNHLRRSPCATCYWHSFSPAAGFTTRAILLSPNTTSFRSFSKRKKLQTGLRGVTDTRLRRNAKTATGWPQLWAFSAPLILLPPAMPCHGLSKTDNSKGHRIEATQATQLHAINCLAFLRRSHPKI